MYNEMKNKQLLILTTALLSLDIIISSAAAAAQDRKDGNSPTTTTPLRIFQALPNDPSDMSPTELSEMHRRLRATRAMVFGGGSNANNNNNDDDNGTFTTTMTSSSRDDNNNNFRPTLELYTPVERRDYLVKKGKYCHPPNTNIESSLQRNDVLSRYDSLLVRSDNDDDAMTQTTPNGNNHQNSRTNNNENNNNNSQSSRGLERFATELWKYCLLYNGDGHVYLGYEDAQLLYPLKAVLNDANANYGVVSKGSSSSSSDTNNNHYLHDSFMAISPYNPAKVELSTMIRVLLETSNDSLALRPMLSSRMMHQVIVDGETNKSGDDITDISSTSSSWTLLQSHCIDLTKDTRDDGEISPMGATFGSSGNLYSNFHPSSSSSSSRSLTTIPLQMGDTTNNSRQIASSCPLSSGGYCCLAFLSNGVADGPVIALRHPIMSGGVSGLLSSSSSNGSSEQLPYKLEAEAKSKRGSTTARSSKQTLSNLGVIPTTDLPYISTVRFLHNHTSSSMPASPTTTRFPNHPANSSNFFDIVFENDCLPYTKECQRCLKDELNEAHLKNNGVEEGLSSSATQTKRSLLGGQQQMKNACSKCQLECPCYCDVLCTIRPPPKDVVRTYVVNPPRYKKVVDRLVPRIIHQTWYEPVTKEKYPNFSRLIESWKKSGWEYYFYDDESARDFLSTHFPPEVGEAYDSITPGELLLFVRVGIYRCFTMSLFTQLSMFVFRIQEPSKLICFVTVCC